MSRTGTAGPQSALFVLMLAGVAIVAGVIANALFSSMTTMSTADNVATVETYGLVLAFGLPAVALVVIGAFLNDRGR